MTLPYDPTGKSPDNLMSETKRLSDAPNKWGVIIPTYAPFFRSDLAIFDDDGNELFEGNDYYLGHYYSELSKSLRRPIYGSLILKSDNLNEVTFGRYRAVGGEHMAAPTDVANYLADPDAPDPRSTDWSVIRIRKIDITTQAPPEDTTEARATDLVTESLWQLKESMIANASTSSQQLVGLTTKLTNLTSLIVQTNYERHIDDTGQFAHHLTAEVVGAVNRSDIAIDANHFHNQPYATFKDRAHNYAMQPEVVDSLLNRLNDEMKGVIKFDGDYELNVENGVTFKVRGGNLLLDTIQPKLTVEVVGDSIKSLLFVSGLATFTLKSNDGVCYYNNLPIITTDEVKEYLNPSLGKADRVYYYNNSDVTFTGIGSISSPLSAVAKIKQATESQIGLFYPAATFGSNDVATSDYLYRILEKINLLADEDFSVNGVPFSANMTFTKDNLGLSRVNNTAPADKQISTLMRAELDKKRDGDHQHTPANITNPKRAAKTVKGLSVYDRTITGDPTKLAYRSQVLSTKNSFDGNSPIIDEMLGRGYLKGHYFRNLSVTENGNDVVVAPFEMYSDGVMVNVPGATFPNYSGYISVMNGILTTSAQGALVCKKVGGELYVYPNYSYGMTREWLEHFVDHDAHDEIKNQGLYSLIQNFPVVSEWVNPVTNPLDTFTRWSHQYNNTDKPAREDELLHWSWDASVGAVYNTQRTNTFVSIVSEELDSYAFTTIIEGVSSDDGVVAILLAAKTVGAAEKNITVTIANSAEENNSNRISSLIQIWEDYYQPSQRLISTVDERTLDIGDWDDWYSQIAVEANEDTLFVSIHRDEFPEGDRDEVISLLPTTIEGKEQWQFVERSFKISETVPELSLPMRYGYGGRNVSNVKMHLRPTFRAELLETYAMQSYLEDIATNQTEQAEVTPSSFQVDFVSTDIGVFEGVVSTTEFISLMDTFDKPHTVNYDYGVQDVTIIVKFLFVDTNGTQLYEPPTSLPTSTVKTIETVFLK